jgi:hypothetical protein
MRPKLTDYPNEPDFFAPIEEWEVFFKTLNMNERREFYSTLEMVIATIRGIRLEKNLESKNRENLLPRFCLDNVCDWN